MKIIFKTIFISGFAVVLNYFINFFLTSYITNLMGIEAYGFVTLSKTFVEYASVVTIALTSFIVRYISVSYHHKNILEAKSYYSSSLAACFILSFVILVIAFTIILRLERVIKIPHMLTDSVKLLFAIVFLSFFITTISSPLTTSAYIKNKLDIVGIIKILSYAINAGMMFILFQALKPEIWIVGVGTLFASITLLLGNMILTRITTPELKFDKHLVSFQKIKNLVNNGVWNSFNQLGNELNSGLDLLISNLMLSAIETGQISVAKSIGVIFSTLNITIFQPFNPRLIEVYAKGDVEQFKNELQKSMKICGLFSSILFAGYITLGKVYMGLWLPEQDYEFLYILSVINVGYNITAGVMQPVYYVSTLTLKNKVPCIITIIGGVLNIVSMYVLLKYTTLGAIGVVVTTTVIMTCINLFFNPIYAASCIKINPKFFYKIIMKHILGDVLLVIVFNFISIALEPKSWIELIVSALIMVIVGIPVYVLVTWSKRERKEVFNR